MRRIILVGAIVATASSARADGKLAAITAGSDVVGAGVFAGSLKLWDTAPRAGAFGLILGLGTMTLAAPIEFGIDHDWGRMGISIATRALLPIVGMVAGARAADPGFPDDIVLNGPVLGFLAGFTAVTVIDVIMAATASSDDEGDTTKMRTVFSLGTSF